MTQHDAAKWEPLLALPLVLVPLWIAPGWMLHYDLAPKAVAVAVCAAGGLLWMRSRGKDALSAPVRTLLLLFAAYAALALAAAMLAGSPAISLGGSSWRRFGVIPRCAALAVVASLALAMASRPNYLRLVLRMASLTGLAASLYAIAQYCGWDPWIDRAAYTDYYFGAVRPPATLGHAAYLATFLLQTIFAAVAMWLREERRIWRLLSAVSLTAAHAAIVLTGTRAALGALIVGWLILAALRPPRRIRLAASIAVAALAAVLAFSLSPAGEPLRARVRQWASDPAGGPRLLVWRDTVRMASTRPLTGFGPDSFTMAFPLFQSEQLSAAYPGHYHESPHNIFLDAWVEQGLAGLALLAAIIAIALRWGLRGNRAASAPLVAGLAAAVLALQFTVFVLPTWLFFLVQVALLAATARSGPMPSMPAWSWAGLRMLALPATAVMLIFAVGLTWAETGWQRVHLLLALGKADEATAAWQALPRWPILGASSDLWFARQLLLAPPNNTGGRLQLLDESLRQAELAVSTSDEPADAHLIAATVWALRGDGVRTEAHLRSAVSRAPHWYKPRWILSKLLRAQGNASEAEAQARMAIRLHGGIVPDTKLQ